MALAASASLPVTRVLIVALLALAVSSPRAATAQCDLPLIAADDPSPSRWRQLGDELFARRRHREAIAAYERALQLGAGDQVEGAWRIARAYAHLGNRTQALRWLALAADRGFDVRDAVRQEPAFEPYRTDPRFSALTDAVAPRRPPARSALGPQHDRAAVVLAAEDRMPEGEEGRHRRANEDL